MFLVDNYVSVLKKYVEFGGRATRSEFWWFTLASFIVWAVLFLISSALAGLYSLAVLLPGLAVGARRLRDAGFAPLLLLLLLIPVVQLAVIVLWIFPSKK